MKMANSGIYWIDIIFNYCVRLLYEVAGFLGITYEEINVWLFVFLIPAVILLSLFVNIIQFVAIRRMRDPKQSSSLVNLIFNK